MSPLPRIGVDIALRRGEFTLEARFTGEEGITALYGPSGSGKTTIISAIAGLVHPERGRITVDGSVLVDTERAIFVPPHRRRIGLVFQDAQLFPHLSVDGNLRYGRWFSPPGNRRLPLDTVVETLGIGHLLARRPPGLSGGEKQRVGLARALLTSPGLLLMDEPLASLDHERRLEILPLIERVRDEFKVPIVYVTHAVEEVARLAACVVVLEAGRVRATGTPGQVFATLGRSAVTGRIGAVSVLEGTAGPYEGRYGVTPIVHPAGTIYLTGRVGPEGARARVVVHGADVAIATERPSHLSIRTVLEGHVEQVMTDEGPLATVEMTLRGKGTLRALVTRMAAEALGLAPGTSVYALVKTVALYERALRE